MLLPVIILQDPVDNGDSCVTTPFSTVRSLIVRKLPGDIV